MAVQQLAMFGMQQRATAPSRTNVIYETKGRAREYRELACNLYTGCDHRCVYCYAPDILKRERDTFGEAKPRTDIVEKVEQDAQAVSMMGERRQVMLCFTCDPYQSCDTQYRITHQAIGALHDNGLNVCVLTKGGSRALRDLDLFTSQDSFGTTLTLLDEAGSLEWEPGAALPSDRIDTIAQFHGAGIPTWVSLEPVIDPQVSLELIRQTHAFVDHYKVGRLNYHQRAADINWHRFAHDAKRCLESLGASYYLKYDLRKEL